MTTTAAYRADWLFPAGSDPIPDAVIEVDASGSIASIRSGRDRDAVDLGRTAIVPSLVNAHVHLEFSDLVAPIGPVSPFTDWIRNVVAYRRGRTGPIADVLRRGGRELRCTGTAAAGEIATVDASHYSDVPIDLTLFREVIGPRTEDWPDLLQQAADHLKSASEKPHHLVHDSTEANVNRGLSPHAPYTVPQELFVRLIDIAAAYGSPVAVHLAETHDELRLLRDGAGELVEMMRSLGLWNPGVQPLDRSPLDWLRELRRVSRGLVVHGNYLAPHELDFVAAHRNLTLVYCPRTHARFAHPSHPFRQVLEQGGNVALGTDGRSSNPDLDLWREAEYVSQRHPDLSSATIVDLVTRAGAAALGISDRHGILAAGRKANFLAVPIAGSPKSPRPPNLFAISGSRLRIFHDGIELDPHPFCRYADHDTNR